MKAIIWTKYGGPDVLQPGKVETPEPKDNEIRIRIHAATVTAGDCEVRSLKLAFYLRLPMRIYVGFLRPQRLTILGQELSGTVDAVGKDVTRFKVGDRVFGSPGFGMGAYAEFKCLPEAAKDQPIIKMAENMSFAEAASVSLGGLEALHFIRQAGLGPGKHLLVNGAGGSIGTYAVQMAKNLGAEVSAVDSAEKLEMLRELGADHVIDYRSEDFTRSGHQYDAIFDVVGKSSFGRSMKALKENGRYLLGNPKLSYVLRGRFLSDGGKKVIAGAASQRREDLEYLREQIEAGALKSVIDRKFPFQETAEAHHYVESGRKQGNVVIEIVPEK